MLGDAARVTLTFNRYLIDVVDSRSPDQFTSGQRRVVHSMMAAMSSDTIVLMSSDSDISVTRRTSLSVSHIAIVDSFCTNDLQSFYWFVITHVYYRLNINVQAVFR